MPGAAAFPQACPGSAWNNLEHGWRRWEFWVDAVGLLTSEFDPGLPSVKVVLNWGSSCSPILTPTLFLPSLHRWKFNCGKAELKSCFVLHPQGLDDFYLCQHQAPSPWLFAEKAFPPASQDFFWSMSNPTVPREHLWFKEALAGQAGNSSCSQIQHQTHPHPSHWPAWGAQGLSSCGKQCWVCSLLQR